MIRIVLDTNVVVSATLRPDGLPNAILGLGLNRTIQLCVSPPVLAEYEEVLARPRLKIQPEKIVSAMSMIRDVSFHVDPAFAVTAASDPDDNIFLECAQAADANYLVTGNQVDFPAAWGSTLIVTPREFIGIIAGGFASDDDTANRI